MTAASADLRSLAADLAYASNEGIQKAAGQVIHDTAIRVQASAQAFAPVRTGRLRDSISVTFTSITSATIGPGVPYGVYQEFGTASQGEFGGAPYVIKPRYANRLVFKVDGKWVSAKQVVHPGVKPQAYMRKGLKEALGPAVEELQDQGALLITQGHANA